MSRWHDVFKQHPIHSRIENIQVLLTDKALKKIEAEAEQEIARLKKLLDLLVSSLSNIDQELITTAQLDNFHNQLSSIEQQLNSFKSNPIISYLQQANNHFDSILDQITRILPLGTRDKIEKQISINSMVQRGEEFLVTLDERKKELQQQIAGLKTSSTHLENKLSELQQQVEAKVSELNQLSSNWTAQFNESQTEKQTKFTESLTTIEHNASADTEKIITQLNEEVREYQKDYLGKIENFLVDATERHNNIRDLHGLVSDDSVTGGHKNIATNETNSANWWRWCSIIFALLAVSWLSFAFYHSGEINWRVSLSGLPITIILLSLAGYTGHQSSLHRHQANRQRQFALEMMAIDPYLENLGDDERKKIKAELSRKYFGDLPDHQKQKLNKDSVVLPNSLPDWIFKVIDKGNN